ncbi:MAG: hypothetical protein OEV15_06900 [Gallionella sp.]|nr:hypothetical protein [Gallionella sp.]
MILAPFFIRQNNIEGAILQGAILHPQPPPCDNWVSLISGIIPDSENTWSSDTLTPHTAMFFRTANLSPLGEFDEIIDVRTPAEFAEDHQPHIHRQHSIGQLAIDVHCASRTSK